jgi:molybdopterin-binding protein
MVDGAVHQIGSAEDVFLRPRDEVVARLVGSDVLGFGVVASSTDGLVEVTLDDGSLVAVGEWPVGTRVLVGLRPEEVLLMDAMPTGTGLSPRNLLPGRVASIEPRGTLMLVTVDAGIQLRALVTRQAVAELGLAPGSSAVAAIKAPSIHLVPAPH